MSNSLVNEIWKDLEDYEGIYQVSSFGRVKSLHREVEVDNKKIGTFIKTYPSKVLKSYVTSRGYELVRLCKHGTTKAFSVHRLVAKVFITNTSELPEVNHIDGNKLNNKVDNLEWCTPSENQKHAFLKGLQKSHCGEENGMSKLKREDVLDIHFLKSSGKTVEELANIYSCSKGHIRDIINFKKWKHLKEEVCNAGD